MQGNTIFSEGQLTFFSNLNKDHVIVGCHGQEVYQLTKKDTGEISLAAFESSVAAKRFFASNKEHFFTKIS